MADRPWTEADQEISAKKLYFVVTIFVPYATVRRPIKHIWGPAPYHTARKRKREAEAEFTRSRSSGTFAAEVIRWRGAI